MIARQADYCFCIQHEKMRNAPSGSGKGRHFPAPHRKGCSVSKRNSKRAAEGRDRRWKGAYGIAHKAAVAFLRSTGINVTLGDSPKTIVAMLGLGPMDSNSAMVATIRWMRSNGQVIPPSKVTRRIPAETFYKSPEWRAVRYSALRASNGRCVLCGAPAAVGAPLHVDHIKPRSLFPDLALDPTNLQVLCEDCNLGKSNTDSIDWRENAGMTDADREATQLLRQFC
jgi:hypothetical protein